MPAYAQENNENISLQTYELPPILVEAERLDPWLVPVREITVGAGIGAESREVPLNSFGVPLKNMERFQDISTDRRLPVFSFDPPAKKRWANQAYAEVGKQENLRLRSRGILGAGIAEVEGGYRRDHSEFKYVDSHNTPLDTSDDTVGEARRRVDTDFVGLRYEAERWKGILETDGDRRDVLAGILNTGASTARQYEADFAYAVAPGTALTAFALSRQSDFNPVNITIPANSSTDFRGGLQASQKIIASWKANLVLATEQANRTFTALPGNAFNRNEAEVRSSWDLPKDFIVDGQLSASSAFVEDSANNQKKIFRVWEAGADLSSTQKIPLGMAGRVKKFSRVPRASEVFGDGALLSGNPDLPVEEGWRASAGPWARISAATVFRLEGFAEESQNAAVPFGVSALNARVIPIGATWTRGWIATAATEYKSLRLESSYTYQDARNASFINWQYGRPLPGRPRDYMKTTATLSRKKFEFGVGHEYVAGETRDIAGFNTLPVRNRFNASVQYKENSWRIRGEGKNLFARVASDLNFEGSAGANILEPYIEETEYLVTLEVLL